MLAIIVETVEQVPMGILSVGNFKAMSSIERPAISRGVTGIFGRNI